MPKVYTAFLVLENGCICQGWSFINTPISSGELVFNTGMTGYQEIMTDPSYCDQIVLFTYPEIGNTGVNQFDLESGCSHVKGIVAKSVCSYPSNWMIKMSISEYLVKYRISHIFGVDTRYLTKQLRTYGVMVGSIVVSECNLPLIELEIARFKTVQSRDYVDKVTTCKSYKWLPETVQSVRYEACKRLPYKHNNLHVIVVDYGVKFNILNRLKFYGCNLTIVPAATSYIAILAQKPDGVLLSNGPGDPSIISYAIESISNILHANVPIFGICLGHQLLSLATGAQTYKLRFGHRGLNHPSGAHTGSIIKMTSQNHGYAVAPTTLYKRRVSVPYLNLNDHTVASLVHRLKPCFSVQYHPEASPGPSDSDYMFAHFVFVMLSCKS